MPAGIDVKIGPDYEAAILTPYGPRRTHVELLPGVLSGTERVVAEGSSCVVRWGYTETMGSKPYVLTLHGNCSCPRTVIGAKPTILGRLLRLWKKSRPSHRMKVFHAGMDPVTLQLISPHWTVFFIGDHERTWFLNSDSARTIHRLCWAGGTYVDVHVGNCPQIFDSQEPTMARWLETWSPWFSGSQDASDVISCA